MREWRPGSNGEYAEGARVGEVAGPRGMGDLTPC